MDSPYASDKSLLLTLRDAAKVERDDLIRDNMKLLADLLQGAVKALADAPTSDNMIAVNGWWVQAVKLLENAGRRNGGGTNGAGLKQGALLAEAA